MFNNYFQHFTKTNKPGLFLLLGFFLISSLFTTTQSFGQAASATWAGTANLSAAKTGNITATNATGGSGISGFNYNATNGLTATNWTTSSSLSSTDYMEFTITPSSGYTFIINSIGFAYKTSSGTWNGQVYYSFDGFSTAGTPWGTTFTPKTTSANFSSSTSIVVNAGTTITVRVYAYKSSGSTRSFDCENMVISGTTCSATSDIVVKSGYTYPQNIAYQNYQATTITGGSSDIEIAQFTIRDGGASSPDADAYGTTLNAITFSLSNYADVRQIALFNGATKLGEVTGAASVSFTGLTLTAADNSTQDFSVRVSFNSTVTDNDNIGLTVTSATESASGSQFAASDAGGAATSVAGNDNQIVVTATKLAFGQQTSNVAAGAAMSPAVTIKAVDALGNTDIDYVSSVSLTSTATFSSAATTGVAAVAGVATFSNLVFTTAATGKTIAATSGSLTASGNSSTFNVTAFANVNTDYFRSIATANWNSTASTTWQASHNNTDWYAASLTPDYHSSGITIASPNTISVSSSVTVDQLVVNSGAQLNINNGITLTLNNGGGTDMDVYGTVQEICTGSTATSIGGSGTIVFENGSLYEHDFSSTSTQGSIPTATWADGSTCEITGFVSGALIHIANISGQSFYNFTWNCTNETGDYGMQGALTTVRGNFTMASTGSAPDGVYGLGASSASFNLAVGGDFIISGGKFDFLNSGASGSPFSLTIGGNYNQTGGTFYSDYSGSGGLPVHFTGSGKSFILSGGTLTTSNMNFYVDNGASITLNNGVSIASSGSFTVSNGGTLYCGTNTISGSGGFTLSAGGTLGVGSTSGINLTTGTGSTTGNITTSTRSYGNANYVYNAATSGITGTGLPASIVSLTVNLTTGSLSITNASTLTISSSLDLQNGILVPNGINEVSVTNASASSVSNYTVTSYVNGHLRRSVNATGSYDFPVGSTSNYQLSTINLKSSTGMSSIVGFFTTTGTTAPNPDSCLISNSPIESMLNAGYWTMTPNAYTAVDYDITLNESGYTASLPGAASNIGVIKRHSSSYAWRGASKTGGGFDGKQGNETSGTQSISGGVATAVRTDVEGFSDYAIAYAGVPLPIELSSFNANVVTTQQVAVKWVTQSELNNNYFVVERSANGIVFDSIGMVLGAGSSDVTLNYSLFDNSPLTGVSYYRLKQVDYNGTSVYSNIVSVNIQVTGNAITQYVANGSNNVSSVITSTEQTSGTLYVTDNLGRILSNQPVKLNAGVNHVDIDMNMFPAGIYFSILKTSNQSIVSEFFFKP